MVVDYKEIAKAWDSQKPLGRSGGKSWWLAIKIAIEKQIPKKPIQDEYFQHDYICSCCGGKLAESVDDNCCLEEEMAGWCPYCGQKLDWSE